MTKPEYKEVEIEFRLKENVPQNRIIINKAEIEMCIRDRRMIMEY